MSPEQDFVSAMASTKPGAAEQTLVSISVAQRIFLRKYRSLSAYEGYGTAAVNLDSLVLLIMVLKFTELHYDF